MLLKKTVISYYKRIFKRKQIMWLKPRFLSLCSLLPQGKHSICCIKSPFSFGICYYFVKSVRKSREINFNTFLALLKTYCMYISCANGCDSGIVVTIVITIVEADESTVRPLLLLLCLTGFWEGWVNVMISFRSHLPFPLS